jgi:hypothetical protein
MQITQFLAGISPYLCNAMHVAEMRLALNGPDHHTLDKIALEKWIDKRNG